jgi:enoyl-CoA hydratase/carnithine racemase
MATRRGQKTSYIFAQHNAGSKFVMLNRPAALNALNLDMVRDLDRIYRRVQGMCV